MKQKKITRDDVEKAIANFLIKRNITKLAPQPAEPVPNLFCHDWLDMDSDCADLARVLARGFVDKQKKVEVDAVRHRVAEAFGL